MSDGGKGSKPRPFSVDQETFNSNWDKVFKSKKTSSYVDPRVRDDILAMEEAFKEIEKRNDHRTS